MRLPAALAFALVAVPAAAQPDPLVRPLPPAAAGSDVVGRMLRELGYEPKPLSPDVLQVTIDRERWPVHVMLSLSTDGRRIWLESKFAPIEDPEKVPPTAWKRLLEANEKIGPAHFAFDKNDRRIHLYKSFDNQAMTVERLRRELDHFDTTVRKTQDYWRGENFKPVIGSTDPPVPEPKGPAGKAVAAVPVSREVSEESKLQGEWEVVEIEAKGRKTPQAVIKDRRPTLSVDVRPLGYTTATGQPALSVRVVADIKSGPGQSRTVDVKLRDSLPVRQIDLVDEKDGVEQGIYKLEADTLTMCFAAPGEPRPVAFTTGEQSKNWVIVLKRVK